MAQLTAAERVDLALKAGAIVGTWVWDVPSDVFLADEQFARSFGVDPELCRRGLPLEEVKRSIHPDDADRVNAAIGEALGRGGGYRCEYRVLRSDGVWRWVEATGEVQLDPEGRPTRFPGVLVDINDRRNTEEALLQANRLLRTFMVAVPGVVYAKDREGRLLVGNRGVEALLGRPFEDFVGRTDMELLDDKAEAAAVMANDRRIMESGETQQLEEQVTFPDGTVAWWHSTKAPLLNEAGEVVGLIGSSVDITARRRAEEHRQLLLNELNHRVKNTLAVVQSLARQTFRGATDLARASDAFEARLGALSRAHNLLTHASWEAADLRDVVRDQVSQVADVERRAIVEGLSVRLPPQVAVSMALALHELGTNAAKYGALSNPTGVVRIAWSVGEGNWLRLRWEESGGPLVRPPARSGFGSRMIERALAQELGGEVNIQYLPTGVVCEILAPLPT
ncbi:sensor histidine kinase [Phenylobacterium zucineum]|uniref:sensor histidine kinase n=1 Tax=Phenylobacterium zucineum TaxID=284016 RepID=UPI0002E9F1CD|nr:sensor histidine kinase [Phenylobacterium zucineum]